MPQKGKVIAIYPSGREYERIQKEAKEHKWKLGPTVMEIVRQFFAKKDTDASS
jgi:hypothetical protein